MSNFISCSICLTDIPKAKIKRAENGKCYVNIQVAERREVDKFGNTHTVYMSQTKEERSAKTDRVFIGSGKAYNPTPAVATPESVDQLPPASADAFDDLPF